MKTPRIIMTAALILLSSNVWAQTGSDKLDVKALEQKYWAAKDDDFSVVQNRAFAKAHKFFGTFNYGRAINDPYYTGSYMGVEGGYYFNETWGVEGLYQTTNFSKSNSFNTIVEKGGSPTVNKADHKMFVNALWMPIYAKMSLFDKKIIHFDMGFSVGVGELAYDKQYYSGSFPSGTINSKSDQSMGYSIGVTQQFYFSRLAALKVDFNNTWGTQKTLNFSGGAAGGNKAVNDTSIIVGLTFFQWWGEQAK
jgi:outer membrane beta-barrel protein